MELKSTRHTKYLCNYHFVWIPKHRRNTLVNEIAEYTKEVLKSIAEELGCEIIALEVMPDHIHLFVNCPPRYAPSYLANYFKGKSARLILKKFPQLNKGKLWTRSYFVATAGNVSSEVIKKYIEEQWRKEGEEE
ncbi:IS200/IS605 family transposase [Saccharolobus solfataricus]|uniref:Transposase, putative n=3 Tax=Saccharolobus solfataricus TaxID=2287 RepID=Q97Y68_SACS2|nr:IS200/IS605 family transposase [Saccharolobus solfataricus]2F4F_A Chain A, Transposase, putative [Saccharolobus solfataricus]2F4F_B Chain B, Transposase, putative [Saccharolobus solfataricus]2F5G_A Chain A, Transposase, putative [Saccharolobus solfataricus]2F5G_B Chain B, Transposase, putative [Saccharolobus solfataricus]AAK41701.1 Transposase, putative [Saccharolobus solfataricus P2]AKA74509.1 IS200/IS605 family transposase [Saccharolobus solfataricus]AKA77205.1 IS200/IS605 family transp